MTRCRALLATSALALFVWNPLPAQADPPEGHGKSHGGGYGAQRGHGATGHRSSTGHYLRHLIHHAKEIGLSDEQVAKIKAIQLDLDRTRIKAEADISIAERELSALLDDEKSELSAIDSKIKQSESMEADLRITAIKARRNATALLTPEQREKEKAVHERMMQQHRGSMGGGMMGGGGMGHGMMGGHGGAAAKKDQEAEKDEDEEKEKIAMAAKAKIPFEQAAQTATQKTAGKVIEVELEEEDDKLVWEVEIVTAEGKLEEVYVDAVAGGVVDIEEDEKEAEKEQEREKK